jgi:hypothetical protein
MRYLVELDYHKTGQPFNEDTAHTFTERTIFPTLTERNNSSKKAAL